jgi:uncharacterized protein YneF (UPF0154 family)
MNLTVLLVGLFVLALFILPFYFVVRKSAKDQNANNIDDHPELPAQQTSVKIKHKSHRKI